MSQCFGWAFLLTVTDLLIYYGLQFCLYSFSGYVNVCVPAFACVSCGLFILDSFFLFVLLVVVFFISDSLLLLLLLLLYIPVCILTREKKGCELVWVVKWEYMAGLLNLDVLLCRTELGCLCLEGKGWVQM